MSDHRRVADGPRPARRQPALLAALLLLVAACGPSGPTPSPNPSPSSAGSSGSPATNACAPASPAPSVDPSTVYQTIEDQVVAIRGLHPKTPVNPTILDEAGLKTYITDSFKKDNPPDVL
ncbi:MAG TPA: hypothetical protein VNM34_05090, partial [Verrucomicrobiae bacterium]|nr:hypothetical protein [Verrucomicrobiae bacterium]